MWHLAYTLLHNPSLKELRKIRSEKQEHTAGELVTEQPLFTAVDNSMRDTVNEDKNKSTMEVLLLDETNSK